MEDTEFNYLATLPGYPSEYFDKLLPRPKLDPLLFHQVSRFENIDTDKIHKEIHQKETGAIFRSFDPASMYYSCLSWVAYPYGIPDDDQPCPYYKNESEKIIQDESNSYTSYSSDESLSDSNIQPLINLEERQPVKITPVYSNTRFAWTG